MSKKEKSSIYNILAFTFDGRKDAKKAVKKIKKSGALDGQVIVAEAVVSVDKKGKTHIHEPGHGALGATVGAASYGLLGLIGGPVGLLAWTVGGAVVGGVAGKYLGRPFATGDLKEIGDAMEPNSSAFLLLVEDWQSETIINKMEGFSANVITLTIGDELSGQIASYMVGEAHDDEGNIIAGEAVVAVDDKGNIVADEIIVAADAEGNVIVAESAIAADAEGDVITDDAVIAVDAEGDVIAAETIAAANAEGDVIEVSEVISIESDKEE